MEILKVNTGLIQTNTYIVCNGENSILVDPAIFSNELRKIFEDRKIAPKYILLTHGHFDHVGGVADIKEVYGSTVISSKEDFDYTDIFLSRSMRIGEQTKPYTVDRFVIDDELLDLDGVKIKVITTPGHLVGSMCYVYDNNVFCGDTIFYLSVGRTDLPTGNSFQLEQSIKNKLYKLHDECVLLPGHGEKTSIKFEKENNPYV